MKLIVKSFNELSSRELFEIYKLRVSVFIVEQQCAYQEIDDYDLLSCHVILKDDKNEILGYLRIIPPKVEDCDIITARIGRVIAVKRRCGIGTKLLRSALEIAKEKYKAQRITLEAQVYARGLYEKAGFKQISEEYLEDGIPHIQMMLEL